MGTRRMVTSWDVRGTIAVALGGAAVSMSLAAYLLVIGVRVPGEPRGVALPHARPAVHVRGPVRATVSRPKLERHPAVSVRVRRVSPVRASRPVAVAPPSRSPARVVRNQVAPPARPAPQPSPHR